MFNRLDFYHLSALVNIEILLYHCLGHSALEALTIKVLPI